MLSSGSPVKNCANPPDSGSSLTDANALNNAEILSKFSISATDSKNTFTASASAGKLFTIVFMLSSESPVKNCANPPDSGNSLTEASALNNELIALKSVLSPIFS